MSVESRGGRAQGRRDQGGRDRRRDDASPRPARPARPPRAGLVAELERLLAPAVAEAGLDLEEVEVRPAGRRRLVRVVVDGDGGVGLDDVAAVSETVSGLLDAGDVMGAAPYVLEVTSPGVDRPLTEPRHWRRAAGRLVVVPLAEGGQIEGRVVAADDEAVEIDVVQKRRTKGAGAAGGGSAGSKTAGPRTVRRRFGLGELGRGRVQVEFKPGGEPGGPSPRGGSPAPSGRAAEGTRSPAEPD